MNDQAIEFGTSCMKPFFAAWVGTLNFIPGFLLAKFAFI
jgi:hypothetical protein